MLELDPPPHLPEPIVPLAHEVDAVRARAEPERQHLDSENQQQRSADLRVDAPLPPEERDLGERDEHDQRAEPGQHHARKQEEVPGAVDQQEAKVPPAVAPGRELRLALSAVVLDRELPDVEAGLGRPDHHLGRQLHSGGPQVELGKHVAADRAHPAVGVPHVGPEKRVEEARQHGVTDVLVEPGHRPRLDPLHPVAEDQVATGVELVDELGELGCVVGQVSVEHHDVGAAGSGEPGEVGIPVAPLRLFDHGGAGRRGKLAAAVGGAVVHHDDLPRVAARVESARSRADACLDGLRLVQTRNHHGDGHCRRFSRRGGGHRWCRRGPHHLPRRVSLGAIRLLKPKSTYRSPVLRAT